MTAHQSGIAQAVPNSSGTEPPRTRAPANAADCHIHIYDPRFAPQADRVTQATVGDYRMLQKRIGLTRVVIVQPRNYAVDNAVTLDAIAQFGQDKARGIAVVRPQRERRGVEAARCRRHSRYPFHRRRPADRGGLGRHDRTPGAAHRCARLARAATGRTRGPR